MPNLSRSMIPFGLAAGTIAGLALPSSAPAADHDVAALRAHGPAALTALLARYDRLPPGKARDALAATIDKVAAQRYATTSRLYWYTDLDAATSAARETHKPILALRMLGRLDEDLSCANSRLFRSTLYANAEVASFLRDNFVLYWSAERPVPRVTIDFGDGRKLERTTTGNSAHYVLDDTGQVLDVLPGLYAPLVFRAELAKSLQLAAQVRGLKGGQREAAIRAYHMAGLDTARKQYAAVAGTSFLGVRGRLLAPSELGDSAIARAQRATMSKMAMEVPDLRKIGIDAGQVSPDDLTMWATIGQQVWKIGLDDEPVPQARNAAPRPRGARAPIVYVQRVLDDRSRTLVTALHTAGMKSEAAELDAMLAKLEQNILADTALNELQLRPQIRTQILRSRQLDFASLNAWIYANVFHTPKEDAWLGLLPRTDFTGLPGDGVVMR